MIRLSHQLLFPQLSRCGDTVFKSWSDSNRSTTLYKLDWDTIDKIKEENFRKWSHGSAGGDGTMSYSEEKLYPGTLPEAYDKWVKSFVFAIPQDYIDEIRRNARMGLLEWATDRHFDTMIREICLMPATAYIYVAFRLISDCLYDQNTNYFYRGDDKIIAPQAILYKFWTHQTGRGLIRDHSYFRNITWSLGEKSQESQNDSKTNEIIKFIQAIDVYEKAAEVAYTRFQSVPVNGPDLTGPVPISMPGTSVLSVEEPKKKKAKGANSDILLISICDGDGEELVESLPSWVKYNFGRISLFDMATDVEAYEASGALRELIGKYDTTPDIFSSIDISVYTGKTLLQDLYEAVLNDIGRSYTRVLLITPSIKIKGFDYTDKESYQVRFGYDYAFLMSMDKARKFNLVNPDLTGFKDFRDRDFECEM